MDVDTVVGVVVVVVVVFVVVVVVVVVVFVTDYITKSDVRQLSSPSHFYTKKTSVILLF